MRIIDADELVKYLKKYHSMSQGVISDVEHFPTAHMAIEALEKQIPKKPIKSDREIRYCEVWKCPSCGFEWSSRVVDFCYKCGQHIDWSKED